MVTGAAHEERLEDLKKKRGETEEKLATLNEQWTKEKDLTDKIKTIRTKLETSRLDGKLAEKLKENGKPSADAVSEQPASADGSMSESPDVSTQAASATAEADSTVTGDSFATATATAPETAQPLDIKAAKEELKKLTAELKEVQGENPLMQPVVNGQSVAEVISGWTGIPIGKMVADEINAVLELHQTLGERVLGQNHALEAISQRIRTSRAGLTDPRRPIGVFLLVGTSGVGKTETALALADSLYGGERNLISINMSEYQEAHTVSSLKGSPPGYVGYGEGGVLTEAVRRKPYSVVLLDEVEKAHPDVMELFFQVFDKGVLEDGEGREIDFKNCVILLTSNVATDTIMKLCADPDTTPEPEGMIEAIRPELIKVFKPALLGRMVVVPYYPISDDVLRQIIRLQLGKIKNRIFENHRAQFSYDDSVIEAVAKRCTEVESGARNVYNILTGSLLPEMSGEVLGRMASGDGISNVRVAVGDDGKFVYEIN
jgi:type VI secretion system protein VasG